MVYDCFTFFNELDLLELRLNHLDKHVDRFVLVEADRTHAGMPKPCFFWENRDRFKPFLHKIKYVRHNFDNPDTNNRWKQENEQRNSILSELYDLQPNDWVLIGDVDEIPRVEGLCRFEGAFGLTDFYWYMNNKGPYPWNGTVQLRGWRFSSKYGAITPQDARNFRDLLQVWPYGGWHFSWLGDWKTKVASFAHKELDTPDFKPNIHRHPGGQFDLTQVPIDHEFPEYLVKNQDKFQKYILE